MFRSHQRDAWDHTAAIIAKLHNLQCVRKSDTIMPAEVNPYRQPEKTHVGDDISALKWFVQGAN